MRVLASDVGDLTKRHRGSASLGGVAVGYGLAPSGILGLLRTSRRAASS